MVATLTRLYYGVDQPSKARRVTINTAWACLGLLLYALFFSDFIPSQALVEWRTPTAITGGIALAGLFYWSVATGRYELNAKTSQLGKAFGLLIVPFLTAAFVWIAICKGFADVVTILIGQPYSTASSFEKLYNSSGRWCDYRLYSDSLTESFPPFLCISAETYRALPKSTIAKVTGKQSFWGVSISAVEFAPSANPPLQGTPAGKPAAPLS